MQVFKTYFQILKKHLKPILIYAFMFLGIAIMISSIYLKGSDNKFNNQKVPVLIVNNDGENELTKGFLDYLGNYVVYIKIKDNESARKDALFYRKVKYILTIPAGFSKAFLKGEEITLNKQVVPDSIDSYSVDSAIDNYFNTAKNYVKYMKNIDQKELVTVMKHTMSENTKVTLDNAQGDIKQKSDEFNTYYFNYLAYIIVAVFITAISTIMLSFHNINIRRKHQAAPISNRRINLQLISANLIFALGYLLIFLVAGYICNPYRRIDTNMILFWINAILFSLTALSISYLVGITVKNKNTVSAISTAISLGMAFISGVFVPQEILGDSVLKIASFTPSYWYVRANNAIIQLTGYHFSNLSHILGYMAIQIGFTAAIISITLVVSKRKSQQAY